MWYIPVLIIASAGLVFGLVSCISGNNKSNLTNNLEDTVNHPNDSIKKQLTRQELIEKMVALSKKKVTVDLSQGAMCYKVAMPSNRAEYVCPVCGEKTLYEDYSGLFINEDLGTCRGIAQSLVAVKCELDEKEFCRHCTPEIEGSPSLCLTTQLKDEEKKNTVCGVSREDMILLQEFFSGKLVHSDDYDRETPLKDDLDKIARLLGIEFETK